ncbi:MAG: AAA family ATPase, partial [Planctomycetaceae bacterium]|nr:AAA family ATPase [Planctomycetaceae bacterium]
MPFLMQLMEEAPDIWHTAEWVRLIREASVRRDALIRAKSLAAELNDPSADPALLADDAERLAKLIRTRERPQARPQLQLVRVADVEPEPVTWLWPNRIPLGKLTLLCGDPGLGKSHLTTDIAARVTRGDRWPDDPTRCQIGSVILFSAEDDVADTIRPRLDRAGADVRKVHVLESVKAPNPKTGVMERRSFSLGEHLPALEQCLQTIGDVRLLVIDPVSSYTGKTDSHKNAEVRTLLGPLADLAQRYDVAVLAVTHLSKGSGGKAVYRATGSLAFAAAARAVWMLARDLDDPAKRVLLPVKCNVAKELTGLAFKIRDDGGGSFVAWDADPVPMTADEYLAAEAKRQDKPEGDDATALGVAVDFVKEQLSAGPMLSAELAAGASANQIKSKTLERARNNLGCKARKRGDGKWEVLLPGHEQRQTPHRGDVDGVDVLGDVDRQ